MNADKKSSISTHVLDTSLGRPAAGVAVRLEVFAPSGQWQVVGEGVTSDVGRASDLLQQTPLSAGRYRLTFATGDYFAGQGTVAFYPQVVVEFMVAATEQHFHVPLLLSPFGYSTYRGS